MGPYVHASHDPKNPWELRKGSECQAPPNVIPDQWDAWGWDLQREERDRPLHNSSYHIGQGLFPWKLLSFDLFLHGRKVLVVWFLFCFLICMIYLNECNSEHRHNMEPPPPDAS